MGKAKRFNAYDAIVAESRKTTQVYGQARQNLSIGSSFRNMPLEPPIITASGLIKSPGTGNFLTASLAADQTTNLAANDHVEFDTKDEDGSIVLQTGAGQSDGIFELESNKKYELSAMLRPEFSGATGQLVIAWFDITNSAEIGSRAIYESQTNTSHNANQPVAEAIVTPDANITAEVRIISVTALTALANEYCIANLFEIALGGSGSSGGGGGGGNGVSFPLTPDVNVLGNTSGSTTIDLALSDSHYTSLTLTGNVTFIFSNPPASGKEMSFVIDILQDGTGGHIVTWPGSVRADPTVGSAANARTVVVGSTVDGGTNFDVLIVTGGTSTSGASKALDNLSAVAINTSLVSDTDDTDDLGTASKEWRDLFIDGTANIDTLAATTMSGTLTMAGAAITTVGDFSFNADNTHDVGTSSARARDVFTHDVRIGSTGAGVGGARQVYGTSSGLRFNTPTATKFFWDVNNVNKFDMSDSSFTGPNIILSDTLTINDSVTDPSANGQFQRNGTDVKVFSGGAVRNLTDIAAAGGNEFDDSLFRIIDNADNTKKIAFQASGITTATTRTITVPDTNFTLGGLGTNQTWSGTNTFSSQINLNGAISGSGTVARDWIEDGGGRNLGSSGTKWAALFVTNLRFNASTQLITANASEMRFGLPTNDVFNFEIATTDELTLSATALNVHGNEITNTGNILNNTDTVDTVGDAVHRFGAMYSTVYRLPTTTSDSTTRLLSDAGGIEYHVLNADTHAWFINNTGLFNISKSGTIDTVLGFNRTGQTIFADVNGIRIDVASGEGFDVLVGGTGTVFFVDANGIDIITFTDSNRPTPATAGAGHVIFNSDDGGLNVSDGTNWRAPSGGWVNT